jgi:hypothetical protein
MSDSPPILQVRQGENGSWHVAITWHSGRSETTGNFRTELEAKEWGHTHLQAWLEGRKARDADTGSTD